MAYLRAAQADALDSYSLAPNLPVAEADDVRQSVKSVLSQCMSTLARRKAAGRLLRGRCRVAEVEWFRVFMQHRMLQDGLTAGVARAGADFSAPEVGLDAYTYAACAALKVVTCAKMYSLSREMQLSYAAFVASAFDLMAEPRELYSVVNDDGSEATLASPIEQALVHTFQVGYRDFKLDHSGVLSPVVDAWKRVERSGAVATRWLLVGLDPSETNGAHFAQAAADAALRGLRECSLVGCASKEVHVSQFKCCGACRTVAYCCREHQLEDWPAHKAACKAARKARR